MLENELIEIVKTIQKQKCESNYIEIKSAKNGCPKLFDTLSSFSNQEGGGKIIFGIDENNDYEICGVYDPADLQKKIMEQSLQMEPVVRPLCTVATINNKTVVSAEIQEIEVFSKPCFYKGVGRIKGSYIRVGDGDRLMTEYEIYSYESFKKEIHDELRIVSRATIEDIDNDKFLEYMFKIKKNKPNLSAIPIEKIRKLQGFCENEKPTLAGILLFGDYPQAYFPQLCITAVVVPGIEKSTTGIVGERFIDNMRIDGTIPQMLENSLNFIRRNMKTKTIIDENTGTRSDKTEYPIIALRELIINSLVHRDYSIHTDSTPITITMYSNRIEIENPGGLYGRMTLDKLGKISADTRNPYIANALETMEITENRYSGIPTVINSMKNYNLPSPKFENDKGIFKVTLYNNSTDSFEINNLSSEEQEILNFCKTPKSRNDISELFKDRLTIAYVMEKYIKKLVDLELLLLTIPDKPKSKHQKYITKKSSQL